MDNISQLPGERKCARMVFQLVYGTGSCPVCDDSVHQTRDYFWCRTCRVKLRPKAVTWLRGSKLTYRQILMLVICWSKNVAPGAVKVTLGISYTATARWYSRFRQHLPRDENQLRGIVEVDEAFFGKQKFNNQKIVIGAVERERNQLKLAIIPDRDQDTLELFLIPRVDQNSLIHSDALPSYNDLEWYGYAHLSHNHSIGQFKGTNRIENVWSVSKRQIRRLYGQVRVTKLDEYLPEWEARRNFPHLFQDPLMFLQTTCSVLVD